MRILVFINGFAFKQGNNEMYFDVAQKLANCFQGVVVVPNTRGHPTTGDVNEMVDDVGAALGSLLGMGASTFEIIAHSSGCSLVALGLLRSLQSDCANDARKGWQELSSFRSVSRAVFLAGVFDMGMHYRHEWRRGVEGVSSLGLVHGVLEGRCPEDVCPLQLAENTPQELTSKLPPVLLLHGDCDDVVPDAHADVLWRVLAAKGARIACRMLPREDHYGICFNLANVERCSAYHRIQEFLDGTLHGSVSSQ